MKAERLAETVADQLVEGVVAGHLDIWWCAGPDYHNDMARFYATVVVENHREVAGIVVNRDDGWVNEIVSFVHNDDKQSVVERIEHGRLNKDRGSW